MTLNAQSIIKQNNEQLSFQIKQLSLQWYIKTNKTTLYTRNDICTPSSVIFQTNENEIKVSSVFSYHQEWNLYHTYHQERDFYCPHYSHCHEKTSTIPIMRRITSTIYRYIIKIGTSGSLPFISEEGPLPFKSGVRDFVYKQSCVFLICSKLSILQRVIKN
jgi:hypothetical protein